MNQDLIHTICQEIYRRYPNFSGLRPKVQTQRAVAKSAGAEPVKTYLLTFQGRPSSAPKGLSDSLRVVVNEKGKILKISTSR